jgi:hypothetical protein
VGPPPPGATRGLGVFLASYCHPAVYAPRARLSTFTTALFTNDAEGEFCELRHNGVL